MENISKFIDSIITEEVAEKILREIFMDKSGKISSELSEIIEKIEEYNKKRGKQYLKINKMVLSNKINLIETCEYLRNNESAMGFDCGFLYITLLDCAKDKYVIAKKLFDKGYPVSVNHMEEEWLGAYGVAKLPYSTLYSILNDLYPEDTDDELKNAENKANKKYSSKYALINLTRVQSLTYKELVFEKVVKRMNEELDGKYFGVYSVLD